MAYKINPNAYDEVLDALWRREMSNGVYHAEWRRMETLQGDVHAIVYVANDTHSNYCGDLPLEE